jgi:hypothetical protein
VNLSNFLMHMKPQRTLSRICAAAMYLSVGFAIGAAVCLGKPEEFIQRTAGTALFFLLIGMVAGWFYFHAEE